MVTLFLAGQLSATFDFAQGVASTTLRVLGSIIAIDGIKPFPKRMLKIVSL
jgi:hypothetical protein